VIDRAAVSNLPVIGGYWWLPIVREHLCRTKQGRNAYGIEKENLIEV
jgi:hypothetical protein